MKKKKKKEFLVDAKWNYERPCALPGFFPELFADLDTHALKGHLLTDQDWERLHLKKEEVQQWDTIEKGGKAKIEKYTAYLARYKNGSSPQHLYLFIYRAMGKQVHQQELANYVYGESGSSGLLSFVRLDRKNKCILIISCTEIEGWELKDNEYPEDGTLIEGEYCDWWNSVVQITSIDMQTLQIETKTFGNGGSEC